MGEAGTEQDAALVRAAKAGDRAALVTLWHRHRPWLAAVILQHKPASVELEDLLQDVAAQLVAKLSSVSEPAALVGWLKATAVNAARWAGRKHEVRERHARLVGQGALARAAEAAGLAEPEARAGEMGGRVAGGAQRSAGAVLELARGLPAEYGEPLLLRAVQGLSYRQIGAILGLPESTVETRIARGRRMLREAAVRGSVAGIRVRGDGAGVSAGAGRAG